jgi:uncharacterized cupin superfamily protein
MAHVVRIATGPVAALTDAVPADKVVGGHPVTGLRSAHQDDARGFYAGVWESSAGSWRVAYTEDELCLLVAGRVRLIADSGTTQDFAAGDAFLIQRGFSGIWETVEPARKIYAILL